MLHYVVITANVNEAGLSGCRVLHGVEEFIQGRQLCEQLQWELQVELSGVGEAKGWHLQILYITKDTGTCGPGR